MTSRLQDSTPILPLPANAASPGEQFAPAGSQGTDASDLAASDHVEEAAVEASAFANLQLPAHLSLHVRPPPLSAYRLADELTELEHPTGSPLRHVDCRS